MTLEDAKYTILLHAGYVINQHNLGLIGRLRPYQGLNECDFVQIVESLVTMRKLYGGMMLEKNIAAAIMDICYRSRTLMLRVDSGIRINHLAADVDIELLSIWIDIIESVAIRILRNLDLPICINPLLVYIAERKYRDISHFIRFNEDVANSISYDDSDVSETAKETWQILSMS